MRPPPPPSPDAIDGAGKTLVADPKSIGLPWYLKAHRATQTINLWRSAHSVPLNAITVLLKQRAIDVVGSALVAQRLKRLPAIEAKLRRFGGLDLSEMQDIAGCRAVMTTCGQVDRLVRRYDRATRSKSMLDDRDDYISKPKRSGYRSYHLIYKYMSTTTRNRAYDGMKVEIQIRSRLQHAWAAAVETADLFTGQTLKTGGGRRRWRRFFALMGSYMAMQENRPPVPRTHKRENDLCREISDLQEQLNVRASMALWSTVAVDLQKRKGGTHYLLGLDATDPESPYATVRIFMNARDANTAYAEVERVSKNRDNYQAVLVRTDSVRATKSAYPSYFADTRRFITELDRAVGV